MNLIEVVFYKFQLLYLNEAKVNRWKEKGKLNHLKYGMEKGSYDIRIACLKAYLILNPVDVEDVLVQMIDDPIRVVSETALNHLEKSTYAQKLKELVAKKRSYWKKHQLQEKPMDDVELNSLRKPTKLLYPSQKESPTEKANRRFDEQKRMSGYGNY